MNKTLSTMLLSALAISLGTACSKGAEVGRYPPGLVSGRFSEGIAAASIRSLAPSTRVSDHGKWGFVDRAGHWIIQPRFGDAKPFSEGLAAVIDGSWRSGKYGYIDKSGKFVIRAQFDDASPFSEGAACVRVRIPALHVSKEVSGLGSVDGRTVSPYCRYGYIDRTGKFVIEPTFVLARPFASGLAAVQLDSPNPRKWGYIDKTGAMVINAQFDEADDFTNNGVAMVRAGGKTFQIDRMGRDLSVVVDK